MNTVFSLKEIEPDEVLQILLKLNPYKSADVYDISPRFIKECAYQVYQKLTTIFNISFQQGKFPSLLKIAKVVPIFKAGSKMEVGNYRPISLLPLFGKILEKLMHYRLYSFIEKHNILLSSQYGFQKNKSTEQALIEIQSKIIDAFEAKETPCCIFLYFAKAFDTVNHDILLHKLNYYGIRGNSLLWLESYLKNREQCVQVGNSLSSFQNIVCGVPQGSVLGPLLFLLYINDIAFSSNTIKFQLFADDTCLFYSHKNKTVLETTINTEMCKIYDWLLANKLSLNVSKSNVLTFRTKNQSDQPILNLKINNENIEEKKCAKYLGVIFDHKLTWRHQIDHICNKLTKSNGLLAKLRHFLPFDKTKLIYNALIQPHLDYGSLSWGSAAKSNLETISNLQKKSIRIINFKKKTDDASILFKENKILPLADSLALNNCKFFWKYTNNKLPIPVSNLVQSHNVTVTNRSPNEFKLNLPYQRTNFGTSFIFYSGVKTWNKLPENTRNSKSLNVFKTKTKNVLLSKP